MKVIDPMVDSKGIWQGDTPEQFESGFRALGPITH